MKLRDILYCFLAGAFGINFGGVFFGIVCDNYFSGEIRVGDMATWVAAFGTISTLGFLIYQQLKNYRHNKSMWQEQKEMLIFQKYQEHQKAFFSQLDYIENIDNSIHFKMRKNLYRSIFTDNDFDKCQFKFNSIEETPFLVALISHYERLDKNLHSVGIDYRCLIEDILWLSNILGADLSVSEFGFIHIADKVELDFFEPIKARDTFHHVIDELIKFTRIVDPPKLNQRQKNIRKEWAKIQAAILDPEKRILMEGLKLDGIDQRFSGI